MDLVHAVFVGAQRGQAAIAVQPHAGQRVQHHVGGERRVGGRVARCEGFVVGQRVGHAAILAVARRAQAVSSGRSASWSNGKACLTRITVHGASMATLIGTVATKRCI